MSFLEKNGFFWKKMGFFTFLKKFLRIFKKKKPFFAVFFGTNFSNFFKKTQKMPKMPKKHKKESILDS